MGMPCSFTLFPFDFSLAPKEVELHLDGFLDLGIFNRLAMFQDQLISGTLETEVDYMNRKPAGFLRIENVRYEHYDWGFLLQDLNAEFDAENDGFVVKQAIASDGGTGRVLLSGGVGADGYDLRLDLKSAHIIRREEFDAILSGGLDITGNLGRPDIKGTLTVDHADIMLDSIATAPPAVLTDFDAAATNRTGTVGTVKRGPPPFGLDIQVQVPEQAFVVASMIEAVLKGQLRLTDTPKGIAVRGRIEPRRGFVNFVGKKFRFTDGGILFNGSVPMEAFFDNLSAEYVRRDVVARLVLNGPVDDPRFRLESSPPLPEDEILSHVLFNRNTSSISPYQAYQIAAAARQLSGGLSGPGFMYQIRQAVGIDSFEIREAAAPDEASKVAAGKYITSGLYVEVNRSLDTQGETGVMAELEVTRHFSVETYTGPKMRPGIGVNWRNDY